MNQCVINKHLRRHYKTPNKKKPTKTQFSKVVHTNIVFVFLLCLWTHSQKFGYALVTFDRTNPTPQCFCICGSAFVVLHCFLQQNLHVSNVLEHWCYDQENLVWNIKLLPVLSYLLLQWLLGLLLLLFQLRKIHVLTWIQTSVRRHAKIMATIWSINSVPCFGIQFSCFYLVHHSTGNKLSHCSS